MHKGFSVTVCRGKWRLTLARVNQIPRIAIEVLLNVRVLSCALQQPEECVIERKSY